MKWRDRPAGQQIRNQETESLKRSDREMNRVYYMIGVLSLAVVLFTGCTANVRVDEQFPDVVAKPRDLNVALMVTHEFRHYVATPDQRTEIGEFGSS